MRLIKILSLLAVIAVLPSCKTTMQDGHHKVTVEDGHHGGHGEFCPPGQAKKGNC